MSKNRWQIAFSPEGDGLYEVTVRRTGSTYRFTTQLPPDISDLWDEAGADPTASNRSFRRAPSELSPETRFFQAANMPTLKEIGSRLFESVINLDGGQHGTETVGALKERMNSNEGVDIEFDLSQTAELSGIPWESLYLGGEKDQFLAIFARTNIVRRLDAQSELPPPIERPIRILIAAANPKADLDTDVELGNIQRRIDELVRSGSSDFEIKSLPSATRDQFRRAVMEWKPHIIHYIGHSAFRDDSGYLYFETDENGVSDQVSAETMRNMLLNRRPWMVILNSCQSGQTSRDAPMAGVAQNLLQRLNIPFVVAMQQPVSDDAAINFSQDFYSALTDGETIASAVTMGRCAIANNADELTQVELITPALYTSGETDRILFAEGSVVPAAAGARTEDSGTSSSGDALRSSGAKLAGLAALAGIIGLAAYLAWPDDIGTPRPVPAATDTHTDPPGSEQSARPDVSPRDAAQDQGSADARPTDQATSAILPPNTSASSSTATQGAARADSSNETGAHQGQSGGLLDPPDTNLDPDAPVPVDRLKVVRARQLAGDTGYLLELEDGREYYSPVPVAPGEYFRVAGGGIGQAREFPAVPVDPQDPDEEYSAPRVIQRTHTTYSAVAGGPFFESPGAALPSLAGSSTGEWPTPYRSQTLAPEGSPPRVSADEPSVFSPPSFCDGLLTTVYFDFASSDLEEQSRRWLAEQSGALDCPRSRLVVAGFTDAAGPLDYNIGLSMDRARAAADAMREVPQGQSKETDLLAFAELNPVIATRDGERAAENRRAEIYVDFDCTSLADAEVSLLDNENFDMAAAPVGYPQDVYDRKPVRIVYQARGFASKDMEVRDRAHMLADGRLEEVSRDVSMAWNVPPGMISSIKIGSKCLAPGDDERVDIDF